MYECTCALVRAHVRRAVVVGLMVKEEASGRRKRYRHMPVYMRYSCFYMALRTTNMVTFTHSESAPGTYRPSHPCI